MISPIALRRAFALPALVLAGVGAPLPVARLSVVPVHAGLGPFAAATRQAVGPRTRWGDAGLRARVDGVVALAHASLPQGPLDMGKATFVEASRLAQHIRSRRTRLGNEQIDRAGLAVLQDEPSAELTPSPSP